MKLLGFKNRMIGWLLLCYLIGYLPLAFSFRLIYPFFLIPAAPVEKFNYVAGIVATIQPAILLYVVYSSFAYLNRVNTDSLVNRWIKKSTQDIRRVALALLIYQAKELLDYLTFENVVPDCFDVVWFLFLWEILPILILLGWAFIGNYANENNKTCPQEGTLPM